MTETMPTKRWTRIELLGGLLVVREAQGSPHAMGIRMVESSRAASAIIGRLIPRARC